MRKLLLSAGLCALCAVGVIAAPIASASAAELTGKCQIAGEAKFPGGLGKSPTKGIYEFEGTANCETASGEKKSGPTKVKGEALLSCAVAAGGITVVGETGAPGKGTIISEEYKFELSFVAQAGVVDLLARPEGNSAYTASGEAEFLTTNGPSEIVKCAQSNLTSLKFEAQTAGTI
jgi:hypothetical protein